jgi:transposase
LGDELQEELAVPALIDSRVSLVTRNPILRGSNGSWNAYAKEVKGARRKNRPTGKADSYHSGKAQFCWAHLKRNLLGILDLTKHSAVERFCRDALAAHARLFRLWHKFRSGQIDRQQLLVRSLPIQKKIFTLAEQHLNSRHREVGNLARALWEHNERLFTFLEHEGVEPTNNGAERALRTGVQWRKICFGNRSARGELATARLLTVAETCELQKLNILAYLSVAIAALRYHLRPASLLR